MRSFAVILLLQAALASQLPNLANTEAKAVPNKESEDVPADKKPASQQPASKQLTPKAPAPPAKKSLGKGLKPKKPELHDYHGHHTMIKLPEGHMKHRNDQMIEPHHIISSTHHVTPGFLHDYLPQYTQTHWEGPVKHEVTVVEDEPIVHHTHTTEVVHDAPHYHEHHEFEHVMEHPVYHHDHDLTVEHEDPVFDHPYHTATYVTDPADHHLLHDDHHSFHEAWDHDDHHGDDHYGDDHFGDHYGDHHGEHHDEGEIHLMKFPFVEHYNPETGHYGFGHVDANESNQQSNFWGKAGQAAAQAGAQQAGRYSGRPAQ